MAQEEKQLLIKDLCGRVPYTVWCETDTARKFGKLVSVDCNNGEALVYVDLGGEYADEFDLNDGDVVKPYLRSMSSMTTEEMKYYNALSRLIQDGEAYEYEMVDWLNEHYLDYRGLIEKGLANEATPENNPYKE